MIDSLDILNTNDAIEHHGIKGMHWGIRRTPEQLGHIISRKKEKFEKYSKKATQAAEKGNIKTFEKYKKKTEKKAKQVIKLNDTLARALKRQAEEDEKIVSTGTLEEVIAISDRLSQEQINKAYNRISSKQKLEGLRPNPEKALDKAVSVGGKVAEGAKHAYNIIDNVNKFKGVMDEMQMSEVKKAEEEREKQRKATINNAIKTGNVDEFKKVWGQATLEELKDMSDTLKMRHEIENPDYSKNVQWQARQYSNQKKD